MMIYSDEHTPEQIAEIERRQMLMNLWGRIYAAICEAFPGADQTNREAANGAHRAALAYKAQTRAEA